MIVYAKEPDLSAEEYRDLLIRSTLARYRPVKEPERLNRMLRAADIILTARSEGQLVGLARSISDTGFVCYLADLAVDETFQHQGIGKALVFRTKALAGPDCALTLAAVPEAMEYYGKIGMEPAPNFWKISRENGY